MRGILKEIAKIFETLPGLGPRSARRITITLAQQKDETTDLLIRLLTRLQNSIKKCSICNNFSEHEICYICSDMNRDHSQICIVSDIADLWAIERMGQYEGIYHVLGGTLSITTITHDDLDFDALETRLSDNLDHLECIIAMNPTIQGQATIHYLQNLLQKYNNITISTLALGIPMGAELDYLDSGTIAMAMASRKEL